MIVIDGKALTEGFITLTFIVRILLDNRDALSSNATNNRIRDRGLAGPRATCEADDQRVGVGCRASGWGSHGQIIAEFEKGTGGLDQVPKGRPHLMKADEKRKMIHNAGATESAGGGTGKWN